MKVLYSKSVMMVVGAVAVLAGLRESVSLVKFWWGVRYSLDIFQGDLLFLSWILFQTVLYLSLTAAGAGLVLMKSWAGILVAILLLTDALLKLIAPPVTRTDVIFAAVSLIAFVILVTSSAALTLKKVRTKR